jgi:hypothetical protein
VQILTRPWVAQPSILAHPAVSLFVTHGEGGQGFNQWDFQVHQVVLSGREELKSQTVATAVLVHPVQQRGPLSFTLHPAAGMNSVMESLAVGKPLFALPRGADQFINAQHVSGTQLLTMMVTSAAASDAVPLQMMRNTSLHHHNLSCPMH